jgi:endonuclease/exonuclease/phosphatase family metal-dependent hydrolase
MKKIIKEGENLVICGDYNATPEESTYKYLEELGFKSIYKEVKGHEPERTFPSGIIAPMMDTDPPCCLD